MASEAFASLGVTPTRVELNANKIKGNYITTAIEVRGDNKEAMRFKVFPGYFNITPKGELIELSDKTDTYDLSKKIRFVPSEFTVQPGKTQKIRINILNAKQLPDGENRALLYIEDVNAKTKNIDTGRPGIGAQLIIKMRMGIPIYVDAGKFYRKGELVDFRITEAKGQRFIEYKINSTGNSRVRYDAKLQIIDGKKLVDEVKFYGGVAGANNTLTKKEKVDLPKLEAKEYTVRLVLSYIDEKGKKQYMKKDTQINVKGEI